MALSYTGKLFRRIAILCGAWTKDPHEVWESTIRHRHRKEYDGEFIDLPYSRGEDGKWHCHCDYDCSREYEFWKAIKWLEESGYISRRKSTNASRNCYGYVRFTFDDWKIKLTEKGLAAAPAYMKKKED